MADRLRDGGSAVTRIDPGLARHAAVAALARVGADAEAAHLQADLLVTAELQGTPSHGLLRLPRLVARIRNGMADPTARGRRTWETPVLLRVDGCRGLGPVVGMAALGDLAERAQDIGIALAAVTDCNHLGMLSWYAEKVADRGLILIAMTISEALVHPWNGTRALLGTNPLAVGVPTAQAPLVVDLATSLVSMGKIHDHANHRRPLPEGWALDAAGRPTTDAEAAKSGAIAPFGGAKGYALGLALELLVVALTGCAIGPEVTGTLDATRVSNKGDVFIVLRPAAAAGLPERLSGYLDLLRACPPIPPATAVRVPGDGSRARSAAHRRDGIPLAAGLWAEIAALAGLPAERTGAS